MAASAIIPPTQTAHAGNPDFSSGGTNGTRSGFEGAATGVVAAAALVLVVASREAGFGNISPGGFVAGAALVLSASSFCFNGSPVVGAETDFNSTFSIVPS